MTGKASSFSQIVEAAAPSTETLSVGRTQIECEEANQDLPQVVFYAWVDAGTQSQPSSMTMRISGGERVRDTTGRIVPLAYVEAKFNAGMLRTSNPEIISEVRRAIRGGDCITEDKEVYLSFVEPAARRSQRLAMRASQLTTELEAKEMEISKLRAQLANRAGARGLGARSAVAASETVDE